MTSIIIVIEKPGHNIDTVMGAYTVSQLQLLLGPEVAGVTTLLLATVVCTWVQPSIASGAQGAKFNISLSHTYCSYVYTCNGETTERGCR